MTMDLTLEQEFEENKHLHKYAILKKFLISYYEDLQNTGVTIPSFLNNKTPEQQANEYIADLALMNDNYKTYNEKYELAWNKLVQILD